jgi:hypothetical protein
MFEVETSLIQSIRAVYSAAILSVNAYRNKVCLANGVDIFSEFATKLPYGFCLNCRSAYISLSVCV